jgi:hypothetical protein
MAMGVMYVLKHTTMNLLIPTTLLHIIPSNIAEDTSTAEASSMAEINHLGPGPEDETQFRDTKSDGIGPKFLAGELCLSPIEV